MLWVSYTRVVRCGNVRGSGLRLRGVTLDWCVSRFLISHLSLSLSLLLSDLPLFPFLLLPFFWPTFPLLLQCLSLSLIHSHTFLLSFTLKILPQFSPKHKHNTNPLSPFLPPRVQNEVLAQQVEENCTSQDGFQGQKGLPPHREVRRTRSCCQGSSPTLLWFFNLNIIIIIIMNK